MQKQTLRQPAVTKFASGVRARPAPNGAQARSQPAHSQGKTAALTRRLLHPALIALPLAFLAGALGTDLGLWLTGDPFWARASLWLTGLGLVMGLLSEIPGWIEFLGTDRKVVDLHDWRNWIDVLTANVMLALALASCLLRLGDPDGAVLPWGIVLSTVITVLILTTGWVGD